MKDRTPSEELDEEVIRFANDHGFALTKEDIKPLENIEIPDEELSAVSGGVMGASFDAYVAYKGGGGRMTFFQWAMSGCPASD